MGDAAVFQSGFSETLPAAALLTLPGRGAVATIALHGEARLLQQPEPPLFQAANGKPLNEQPLQRVVYGWWGETVREEVVLCRCAENWLEIHCHGGMAAAKRILDDLQSRGVSVLAPRDILARQQGVLQAECEEVLSRTRTTKTANYLLPLVNGRLEEELSRLLDSLQRVVRENGLAPEKKEDLRNRIGVLLHWSDFGRHLTVPWKIVLCGRPNVGKSSLINQLAGQDRSIVADIPGTTRDIVTVVTAFDGWPVELADTAGWRETGEEIEAAGIRQAREQLRTADCCLLLWDVSVPLLPEDFQLLEILSDPLLVLHKCDLPAVWQWEEIIGKRNFACTRFGSADFGSVKFGSAGKNRMQPLVPHFVSSRTGEGVAALQRSIVRRLLPEIPPAGTPLPVTERQVGLLREAEEAIEQEALTRAVSLLQALLR